MERDYRFEVFTDYCADGKQYVVKYVDFETVIGVGDTIEEAIEEARGNLDAYIEACKELKIAVPEPSMHVYDYYSGKVTLRMSKTLHKQVDERAKKEGISINSLLNEAIAEYIERRNYTCYLAERNGDNYYNLKPLTVETVREFREKLEKKNK